ncbi:MAG: tRNA pseudouridine(38-40) synthase TruA, partial [Bacteroidota bacterium]
KYHGWQKQKNCRTIQEEIELVLAKILKRDVLCHGCGRTDAGVHAKQYFAHINFENEIEISSFIFKMNKALPNAIAIYDLIPLSVNGNAQRDATKRTYEFYLHHHKNPFLENYSVASNLHTLDLEIINETIKFLKSTKDFRSLCIQADKHNHTLCNVLDINFIMNEDKSKAKFDITADRFLRKMIRIIVARLIDLGNSKLDLKQFIRDVRNGNKPQNTRAIQPHGLYLSKIEYPFIQNRKVKSNLLLDWTHN